MSDLYRDFIFAARVIEQANALLGNGVRCPWTADDMRDLASSVAGEAGPGVCPICKAEVTSTGVARIRKHRNTNGELCSSSGQWFFLAVEDLNA